MHTPPVPRFLLEAKKQQSGTLVNQSPNLPPIRPRMSVLSQETPREQRNFVQEMPRSKSSLSTEPSPTDQVFSFKHGDGELQIIVSNQQSNKYYFFVTNLSFFEFTVRIVATVNNMSVVREQEPHRLDLKEESDSIYHVSFIVGPNVTRRTVLFHLAPKSITKVHTYQFQFQATLGDRNVTPDPYHYGIPLVASNSMKRVMVGQGFHGSFSHYGRLQHCIDFVITERTPIVAARDGIVCKVVQHFTESGSDPSFENKGNMVMILHSDGTMANYVHLVTNGAKVHIGQSVTRGQVIGLSGNTGRSTQPHLHFHVCSVDNTGQFATFPYVFSNGTQNGFVPQQLDYVALN